MSARFAGSLELAQRRRRRLAQEADSLPIASGTPRASRVAQQSPVSGGTGKVSPYSGPRLPRDTMIPGSWAVIAFLGLLGFSIWVAILWLGLSSFAEQMGIGPLASLTDGSIPRYFSTVALLLTAQLSLLIYWHRSRSRKDFLGRYRVWGWAGLFWCLICLAQTTQCHLPLLHWMNSHYAIQCWRGEHLCWFLPLATCLLALYRLVGRDINPSRASSLAWNTAFCIGLFVAGIYFGLDLLFPVSWRGAATAAVSMLWQYSLALFCLIHARYVTHVSNEAGGKRISLRSRMSRWLTARLSQLGERILAVRLWRSSQKRAKGNAEKMSAASRRRKLTRDGTTASAAPSPEGLPEKLKPREKPSSAVPSAEEHPSKLKEDARKSADQPAPSDRPSWGSRFRQAIASRWTRRPVEKEDTSTPAATSRRSVQSALVKEPEKASKDRQPAPVQTARVKTTASSQEKPAAVSSSEESGPSWGERLKGSLMSRWTRRADPPQAAGGQAGPHLTPPPSGAKAASSVAKQKTPAGPPPEPVATARPTTKSEPLPRPTSSSRPVPRHEMEDDEDDDDSGPMSRKDRKRQKKRERQRD